MEIEYNTLNFFVYNRAFSRHSVSCEHIDVQVSHNDLNEDLSSNRFIDSHPIPSTSHSQQFLKGILISS